MVAIGAPEIGMNATRNHHEAKPLLPSGKVKHDTPEYHAMKISASSEFDQPSVPHDSSMSFLVLQVIVVASIIVYTLGHTVFTAAWIQFNYLDRLGAWFTEPATTAGGEPKVHFEMQRPTYLFLYTVLPFAIGTIALEAMRGPQNLHRVVSRQVLRVGMLLRRKPSSSRFEYLRTFSYGELLFLTLLVGGNMVMFVLGWFMMQHWFPRPGTVYTFYSSLEITGIVMGYNCVYNMAFLFLPTTRSSAWMEFMGISYANGMKFHRWLGVATLVTGVAHALPFYPVWYDAGVLWEKAMPCFDCSLDYLSKGYPAWFNVFGEISLIFMLVLGVTSLPWIRRHMYETFYYTHYLFVPCVIFAVLHWGTVIWWLLPSFTIYLVDRVLGSTNAMSPVPIIECSVLADDILKVVVARSSARNGDFEVGQFVYMNVPAISKWQWHAFTIGSSPRGSKSSFTVWLKSLGNWTEELVQYARECEAKREQPVMYIDGYYGASLESYDQYGALCLIGGGIGVTPLFAMLEDIACRVETRNERTWPRTRRVHFVFTFREMSLLEEIHPVMQRLLANEQIRGLFSYEFYLTRKPSEKVLDEPLSSHRPAPSARSSVTKIASDEHRSTCPFAEPLRSGTYRALLYATVIVGAAAAVVYLDYDGGVVTQYGAKTQYWPLQNLVDCMVMFAIAPLAYLFILLEKTITQVRHYTTSISNVDETPNSVPVEQSEALPVFADSTTYRDLLLQYRVAVGARPEMLKAIRKVHADFSRSPPANPLIPSNVQKLNRGSLESSIGVFISGPEALKRATEDAVGAIDSSAFDIHDEEFEL